MIDQELATAVQYELSLVVILVNNGMYGTIRMHQEKRYPGRISGTDLVILIYANSRWLSVPILNA